MKKILSLIIGVTAVFTANAQSFEFRYKGQSLPNGETITIMAEKVEDWGDPFLECNTNPSGADFEGLYLYNLTDNQITVNGKIEVSDNDLITFGSMAAGGELSWCMGTKCEMVKKAVWELTGITVEPKGKASAQYHAILDMENYGSMTTKMSATSGSETAYIFIKFISTPPQGITTTGTNATATETARYTVDGQKLSAPTKGVNIVKMSDGRTFKQVVK